MVLHISPLGVVLNETENPPKCNIFTLSAKINGTGSTGNVSHSAVDMDINITPGVGRRGMHQYELRVSSFSLQFQWRGDQNWINNGITKPTTVQALNQTPLVPTDKPNLFPASLRKSPVGQTGPQSIKITWKHGKNSPRCTHTVTLKV